MSNISGTLKMSNGSFNAIQPLAPFNPMVIGGDSLVWFQTTEEGLKGCYLQNIQLADRIAVKKGPKYF